MRPSFPQLPMDNHVGPVATRGGPTAAQAALAQFLEERLSRHAAERNEPEQDVTSGLSPYLHYGHISAHQVSAELMQHEQWSPDDLGEKPTGSGTGWWG